VEALAQRRAGDLEAPGTQVIDDYGAQRAPS
jgi:hypothetical protein